MKRYYFTFQGRSSGDCIISARTNSKKEIEELIKKYNTIFGHIQVWDCKLDVIIYSN